MTLSDLEGHLLFEIFLNPVRCLYGDIFSILTEYQLVADRQTDTELQHVPSYHCVAR